VDARSEAIQQRFEWPVVTGTKQDQILAELKGDPGEAGAARNEIEPFRS
jgi:hypothetical protein